MKTRKTSRSAWVRSVATMAGCVALVTSGVASAAAEIVIINLDEGTGAGLDDPELGAQRMAAM